MHLFNKVKFLHVNCSSVNEICCFCFALKKVTWSWFLLVTCRFLYLDLRNELKRKKCKEYFNVYLVNILLHSTALFIRISNGIHLSVLNCHAYSKLFTCTQDPKPADAAAACDRAPPTGRGGSPVSARRRHEHPRSGRQLSTLAGPGQWPGGHSTHTGQFSS